MAWSTTDVTELQYGITSYYFAPTELIYTGNPAYSVNQVVQESESGEVFIQQLDSSDRQSFEFRLNFMPEADRTVGGLTIRGFTTLNTIIRTTLNYRENVVQLAPSGTTSLTQVRYWSDRFAHPWTRKASVNYHGNGSTSLQFRKEV